MRFALLLVAACEMGIVPVTPEVDTNVVVGADHRIYAVARLIANVGECSNMGGEHDTLEIDEPVHRLIHAGGHGMHLVGGESSYRVVEPERYYIAVLDQFAAVDIADPGWCLHDLPHYAGHAEHLVPARDLADAQRRLAEVAAHGIRE
jgi:hypothetical protein